MLLEKIMLVLEFVFVSIFSFFCLNNEISVPSDLFFRYLCLLPLFIIIIHNLLKDKNRYSFLLLLCFILYLIADNLLPLGPLFFMIGLGVFFISHILLTMNLIILFPKSIKKNTAWFFIPFSAGLLVYIFLLWPDLDLMLRILLAFYLLIFCIMIWRAGILQNIYPDKFVLFLKSGAILFYICDLQVGYFVFSAKYPFHWSINNFIYYAGLSCLAISGSFFSPSQTGRKFYRPKKKN